MTTGTVDYKVHSSEGGRDRELSWCHNVAVGIVTQTAHTMPVAKRIEVLATVSGGGQLVVCLHLFQTSRQRTIAGVAHRPQRYRVPLPPTLLSPLERDLETASR